MSANPGLRIAFLDMEASSLAPESYPVEIGIAMPARTAGAWTITVLSWLIRPTVGWASRPGAWSDAAQAVHGISMEELAGGLPPAEVAQWLDEHLTGRIVVTDSGRHGYDAAWLAVLGAAIGDPIWPRRWRIARETAGELVTNLAHRHRIPSETLAAVITDAPPHEHTAGGDALRLAWLWCTVQSGGGAPIIASDSRYRRLAPGAER